MQSSFELPISKIKVRVPPRVRELISRPRLIDSLFDLLDKHLILVVAPAGYGKTSLLVDFAQQSELPFCWLSLDSLDQEPQRFLRYMIASIAEKFPNFGKDSLAALDSMTSFEQDAERLLVTMTNEINATVRDHFALIMDDYQLVAGTPPIEQVISRFLHLTGENVHLILASRIVPDLLDAPLMIGRNQLGGLSFEELSFRAEEIQQLFLQNKNLAIDREKAEALVRETEGWVAAIHLTNGQTGALPPLRPLESTRELFDFFSKEVMNRLPQQMRRFMLMTSLFEAFDISLCKKVLGPLLDGEEFDWEGLFEVVQSGHFFSIPLENEGRWMRYHNLFQHFLRSQQQYENPVLTWQIQKNLARAYEEQQAWEEALQIYSKLGDHENLVRLMIQVGTLFVESGHLLSLAKQLDELPVDVVYSQPVLVSLLGVIRNMQGDDHQALEIFRQVEPQLLEAGNELEWSKALVRRADIYRQVGEIDQALADADKIINLFEKSPKRELQDIFAEALRVKGGVLLTLGRLKEGQVWLEKSLKNFQRLGLKQSISIVETDLGVTHRKLGEHETAARYYASALRPLENAGSSGRKALLLNNTAMLYYMTGKLDKAYAHLQDALATAERSGYVPTQALILITMGDLLADLEELASAYGYYDKALTIASQIGNHLLIFYASLGDARLKRLKGEAMLAVEGLKQAELSQTKLGTFERALFNLELGLCWLDANKMETAIFALQDAAALFEKGENQTEQAIAGFWLATAMFSQSPDAALPEIKKLIPPQRDWNNPTPLMIQAGRAGRWLKSRNYIRLFRETNLRLFFDQAERTLASIPRLFGKTIHESEHPQPASPQLEVFSFGDARVSYNHRALELSDWKTREARDLFLFMLQSPPRTKEQIALAFWPDISPARLKARFKINMYRIRQALRQDIIIFEDNRYRVNRTVNCCWDREKFDELYQSARQKPPGVEKIRLLEQATELVNGDYFADMEADWVISGRIKYQDLHREATLELAALYLERGQARNCLNTARGLLRSDALLEGAHRLVLQAYAKLGDSANIKLHFSQYQKLLKSEMGLEPSPEIKSLYRQLIAVLRPPL